jgi:hypothetical protein
MASAELTTWLHSEYGDAAAPKGKAAAARAGHAWSRKVAAGG